MNVPTETAARKSPSRDWLYDLLFVLILLMAAYFRFTGLDWDEGTYLHPDERFLAMVESSIEPVGSFREYWQTQTSSLNPNNRDHGFFVYGTLPIFLARYVMEWSGQVGYGEVAAIGRPLAGLFDLLTIFVLYLTAGVLYNRRVALLAAAFSALAVLQIQLSHFFTVDLFANFFIWLALFLGAVIVRTRAAPVDPLRRPLAEQGPTGLLDLLARVLRHPLTAPTLFFGVVAGMAVASKVSAYPVVLMLPLACWLYALQLPEPRRIPAYSMLIALLVGAGILAALSFRVFQPYAFAGSGFFDVFPNELWLEQIGRLRELVKPSSGYPPSVQWFDRPLWFSGKNLTIWGLGLPLGLAAWAGFLWMGYRIVFRRELRPHFLLWAWVGGHFLWQSTVPNPTMRYQIPIYPGMALMAAWGLVRFWDWAGSRAGALRRPLRVAAGGAGLAILSLTLVYALGFLNIYRSDVTRIAASRWMYQNLPGALTVRVQTGTGMSSQLLPFPNGFAIRPGEPYTSAFVAAESGALTEIYTPHLLSVPEAAAGTSLFLQIAADPAGEVRLASAFVNVDLRADAALGSGAYVFDFGAPVPFEALTTYYMTLELIGDAGSFQLCEPLRLVLAGAGGLTEMATSAPEDCRVASDQPYRVTFTPESAGEASSALVSQIYGYQANPPTQTISLSVLDAASGTILDQATTTIAGSTEGVSFPLVGAPQLTAGATYSLVIQVDEGPPVAFAGTVLAQETSWDDPLPMRVDGYDGFGGIYKGENNLELYWEDNPEKVQRIIGILDAVDVIPISSNRQWGSLTRLPERWPVVEAYYRNLIGCPPDKTVEWCYTVAEPGMFTGALGFELVEVFQSNPTFGPFEVNDQFAEEAFTVYDHPKVLIFVKTDAYDPQQVRALLGNIPMPGAAQSAQEGGSDPVKSLLMSEDRFAQQQEGGTWSDLFSRDRLVNRFQPAAVLVWYAAVALIGLAVYPLLRWALPGLDDRGYPFARTLGLLLFGYTAWMLGSAGAPVTRGLLTGLVLALLAVGGIAAFFQRESLRQEWREKREYILSVEAFGLALFLLLVLIRAANPDLWHPWKGGEKPMDFAYFNAILRSLTFPPYDPWFSGGYINYYYFGFVIVGMPVKWLGIVPSVAYNLIVPTLFMLVGTGAFSLGWNFLRGAPGTEPNGSIVRRSYLAGLAAALGVVLLGNLGSVRMIFQGYQRVVAPPEVLLEETFFLTRWVWAARGFIEVLTSKAQMPYALADWYWLPSRAIPAPGDIEPITEFPFFTFLYADLHAHMIALPLTLLALAWALSVLLGRARWHSAGAGALAFLIGGLVIGALRPTNTWDYPTYLLLAVIAFGYAGWRSHAPALAERLQGLPEWAAGLLVALSGGLWLTALSWFLYQPYSASYALGYTDVNLWQGTHTSLNAYLTHWGPFLFIIVTWMAWETRGWLAETPAVAGLAFLRRIREFIFAGLAVLLALAALLTYLEVRLAFTVLPLAAWAAVLLFRPGLSDARRAVLFMTGTGLFLTLMVETIVLSGDIGRMNTVFKFYLQVWILFGISAAASLGWLIAAMKRWLPGWQRGWQFVLGVLVFCMALYPLLGGFAKMKDRMAEGLPVTLDGMAYMEKGTYFDQGAELQFIEDYHAIRWLQDTVVGTPVIVEGQVVEYRWGSRYSIYTGLPAVLGWNWHQRQQRTGHDGDVWDRAGRIEEFYTTTNVNIANRFLDDFDVTYIIVGQMERAYYSGHGLDKFEAFDGRYWSEVYRDGATVIYQVIR